MEMIPHTNILLLLVLLFIKWCRNENIYCKEAVASIKIVPSCPTSKEKWDDAANRKNCSQIRQECSPADKFQYHCVINGFRNATLEVCAPKIFIFGVCTEFNVAGGIIQGQRKTKCNERFPKCIQLYNSTDAYKYPDCYQLVYNGQDRSQDIPLTTMQSPKTTSYESERVVTTINSAMTTGISDFKATSLIIAGSVIGSIILTVVFISVLCWKKQWYMCKKDRPQNASESKEEGEDLMSTTFDSNQTNDITIRIPPIQKIKEAASPTDKYVYAVSKSDDDIREENKEESSRYLKNYKRMNKYFVETKAYCDAKETFHKNGIVILTGPPGCGKTIAAIHMIFEQMDDNEQKMTFRNIQSWEELSYVNWDEQTIVLIDNIFFRRTMDLHLEDWWTEFEKIHNNYFACNLKGKRTNRLRIIISARENVIERACCYMEKTTPILHDNFLKDISKLTETEKDTILTKQIEFARLEKGISIENIDAEFKKEAREADGPIGFPLCAHLYVCGKEYRKSGAKFFSSPIQYLKILIRDEIGNDTSNRKKSLFFYLFFFEWHTKMGNSEKLEMKNENKCRQFLDRILSKALLRHFEPFDLNDIGSEAQKISGAFFKRIREDAYKFVHDSVYEAVGAYFCETYVTETTMYFPLDVLQNKEFENLTDEQTRSFATRLLDEALTQRRLSEVFSCRIFLNEKFCKLFCLELMKKDTNTISMFFTIANESSAVKLPCMFWSSFNNLDFLTEPFYDIVSKENIKSSYNLYVFLYGLCCSKNQSMLKTTNGMFYDELSKIKGRVLSFKDAEENSIIHYLITSNCSDRIVAIAVEQLVKDGMSVVERNKQRTTPIMLAVEQKIPRTQVIKCLMKSSPKLHYQDSNNSTVLHHCLRSCNDDKTCADYLDIILKKKDKKDLLTINDDKGDTALTIAAKHSKQSRIQSILILLEGGADIINTLNEDGYSPLHLAVRSLNENNAFVELECCVRVITFILYGASADGKSDKNAKALNECQQTCIRKILRDPKNTLVMKNELEFILRKLNQQQQLSKHSLFPCNKIDTELKLPIAQAIHLLQHVNFDQLPSQTRFLY